MKSLTISPKQHEMFIALEDREHTEVFLGGAAGGCGIWHTSVHTLTGSKFLGELEKCEIVLTFNKKKNILEYKPILETFINGGSVGCVELKLKDGTKINFTQSHEFLFDGEWVEIGELARRSLDGDKRNEWAISNKQQREIKNNELEKFWENYDNESRKNKEGLLENYYYFKRTEKGSNSQGSSRSIHSKPTKQTRGKSQGLKQKKQPSGKSGMGNSKGKLSSCGEIRSNESIHGECWKKNKLTNKTRLPERNEQTNRATSQRDTTEIHPEKIRTKAVRDRIWSKSTNYQGYCNEKKLEAREINLDDILEIRFYWQNEPMYDIETENESYVLANGIIVHNSKSFTLCLWQIMRRMKYKGSRGFLARARLKDLKASTLLTFFEVCGMLGLKLGVDYKYNSQTGVIIFSNGSEEYLKDLFLYPSDPDFVSLGSTEYTDGAIDEMGDITPQAYQIMRSRIRFKLDEFGLIPKMAMGSNPCKTFIYGDFYKKWRDGELEFYKAYVQAGVYDNPFISDHYIENLKKLDTKNRERLLNGNWEYDDDPTKIFDYDCIIDLFTNDAKRGRKYCIVDQSGFGRDSCIVSIWDGLFVTEILKFENGVSAFGIKDKPGMKDEIGLDEILTSRKIPRSRCLVDEIGVGFGLKKAMPEIIGFVANAAPLKKEKKTTDDEGLDNYKNLRSQCWFELANHVNSGLIGIYRNLPINIKELLIEDLEVMKQMDSDKDSKMRVITKKELHDTAALSRSTDVGDCLVGNTNVLTTNGYKFIKDINIGEKVITPYGSRKVLEVKRKKSKQIVKIKFNNGKEIYCTPNHKIYLNDSFKKVKALKMREYKGEILNTKNLLKWRIKRLFTKEKDTGFYPVEDIITRKEMEKSKHCIEEFMRIQQEDQSLKDTRFTILTETISIIIQRILQSLNHRNIKGFMQNKISKTLKKYVNSVKKNLLTKVYTNAVNIAQTNVFKTQSIKKKDILKEEIVYTAEKNSASKNKTQPNAVQEVVLLSLCGEIDVYDLKVQKDHCYYANDILVSNCLMMRMYFEINPNESAWTFPGPIESVDEENKLKVYGDSNIKTKIVDGAERRMVGDRIIIE